MLIAVVNESTRLSPVDSQRAVDACAKQLRYHAAPAWTKTPAAVILYPTVAAVPLGADVIAILDNADQAGALGYHDETPDGRSYGRVFVSDSERAGVAVSSVLSHEVLELFVDPTCCGWEWDGSSALYAREVGDPVEADSYLVTARDGAKVSVSNFVFPAWFDPQTSTHTRLDQLRRLTLPFTITRGGYVIQMYAGKVTSHFGEAVPEWKRESKAHPASRTRRRHRQSDDT